MGSLLVNGERVPIHGECPHKKGGPPIYGESPHAWGVSPYTIPCCVSIQDVSRECAQGLWGNTWEPGLGLNIWCGGPALTPQKHQPGRPTP